MKVKILKVATGELEDAVIEGRKIKLPGLQEGWKFSFDKHIRALANAVAYVLVADETPDETEGCLIFQMKGGFLPHMAFVEAAPHNRKDPKRYDYVAGCLIAFAYKLSLTHGKEAYKGYLTFEVGEEQEEDQVKLMALYSQKYNARRIGETEMLIADEDGDELIKKYLEGDE